MEGFACAHVYIHTQILTITIQVISPQLSLQLLSRSTGRVNVHNSTFNCSSLQSFVVASGRELIFTEHLLCAKQCTRCFKHLNSLNSHNKPVR